ncbi:MAG: translocation/assembly module TamB, partial [Calditrichaeota bacterium]
KLKLISISSQYLRGQLHLKAIKGNPLTEILLQDLQVEMDNEEVISIKNVYLDYSLLALFNKDLVIHKIVLEEPKIKLKRLKNGAWNLSELLKASTQKDSNRVSNTNTDWQIILPNVTISSGEIEIKTENEKTYRIPEAIQDINVQLGVWFTQQHFKLQLQKMNFRTLSPDLKIQSVLSEVEYNDQHLEVRRAHIESDSSRIISHFSINDFKRPWINFFMKMEPLSTKDVRKIIPTLTLYGNPNIEIDLQGPLERLKLKSKIKIGKGQVLVQGNIHAKHPPYKYSATVTFKHFNLANLTGHPEHTSNLNFLLNLHGQGISWPELQTQILTKWQPSSFSSLNLNQGKISSEIKNGIVQFNLFCNVEDADFRLNGFVNLNHIDKSYEISGIIAHFDLNKFFTTKLFQSDLNLKFQARGHGFPGNQARSDVAINLTPSTINQIPLENADFEFLLNNQTLQFKQFKITSPAVDMRAQGEISIERQNELTFLADFHDFSLLTHILPLDSLSGAGQFRAQISGPRDSLTVLSSFNILHTDLNRIRVTRCTGDFQGLFLKNKSRFNFAGTLSNLSFLQLDSLNVSIKVKHEDDLTDFVIKLDRQSSPIAYLRSFLTQNKESLRLAIKELNFNIIDQTWRLGPWEPVFIYKDSLIIIENLILQSNKQQFRLAGTYDFNGLNDLNLQLRQLDLAQLFQFFTGKSQISGQGDFLLHLRGTVQNPLFTGQLVVANPGFYELSYDTLWTGFQYQDQIFTLNTQIKRRTESERLQIKGEIPLQLNLQPFQLKLPSQPVDLEIMGKTIQLDKIQKFIAARRGLLNGIALKAPLNFYLTITGTLDAPVMTGQLLSENGQYSQVTYRQLLLTLNYFEDRIFWRGHLQKDSEESPLETSGFFPVHFSLVPFELEPLEEPLQIKLSTRTLDISFLQAFTKNLRNIEGKLVCDIVLGNTLDDLTGVGPIRIIDGQFDLPELGTRYKNIDMVLILNGREMNIKEFSMESDGGKLYVKKGSLSISKSTPENFKATLRASNFPLMKNKKMHARVNALIELSGSIQRPQFSGIITVLESRIFYPAWFEEEEIVRLTEQPFFVIQEDTVKKDTLAGALKFRRNKIKESLLKETALYKNARGELTIYFPRNTWIRSNEANIEIEGDLELVKEGEDFVLFGTLSAVRGYYTILGNRFQVVEGTLVFDGDPELNPSIHITARTIRQVETREGKPDKKEIKVVVTGTQKFPQFQFFLNGQEAEQQDVLSILIFGRSFDDLTLGEQSGIVGGLNLKSQATSYLTGPILNAVLANTLGKELQLDVFQIERGKSLSETKLRIGKYVTPDVFVSLSQDFGAEGTQTVELEYEIPKKILFFNLFLQVLKERKGETGMDVIWKIEW